MENNSKKTGMVVAVIVAVALIGAAIWAIMAINNDDQNANTTGNNQTEQTSQVEQAPGDIVAVASDAQNLSTLVTAVKAAELVETLQGTGPFTVFAPTNQAFEQLPDGTLDELLKPENKEQLASILTYHVVPGEVRAAELSDGQKIDTVQGEQLTVEIQDGSVYLIDTKDNKIMVETPDVKASNGIVHIIGGVLMPN